MQNLMQSTVPLNRNVIAIPRHALSTLLSLLWLFLTPVPAASADQNGYREQIRDHLLKAARKEWPEAEIDVSIQIDPRLQLRPCTRSQIELRGQQRHGRVHVALKCGSPSVWSVYIPAEVHVKTDVLVAVRALPRGHTLADADVRTEKRLLERNSQAVLTSGSPVAGLMTRRPVSAGTVLSLPLFAAAAAVKKGEVVRLASGTGPIRITTTGKVLEDGRIGDQIAVENSSTGKKVRAWVTAAGEVSSRPLAVR